MRTRFHLLLTLVGLLNLLIPPTTALCQGNDARTYPPPGKLVDIGGYRLHINCTGEKRKRIPTVILMHGLAGYSFDWSLVQPEVARFTRVCSYDRAGQAWSEPGSQPRGIEKITNELHTLLQNAREKGSYVLVGHSWGGLVPRVYANLYPSEVAGIVFVDSSTEGMSLWVNGKTVYPFYMNPKDWDERRSTRYRDANAPLPGSAVTFKKRTEGKPEAPFDKLPPEIQQIRVWARSLPRDEKVVAGGDWGDVRTDLKFVAAANGEREYPLGDIPVVVLSGTRYDYTKDDEEAGLSPQQKKQNKLREDVNLARLSRNGKLVIAQKSGHHIHIDQPELVIDAIRAICRPDLMLRSQPRKRLHRTRS